MHSSSDDKKPCRGHSCITFYAQTLQYTEFDRYLESGEKLLRKKFMDILFGNFTFSSFVKEDDFQKYNYAIKNTGSFRTPEILVN
jgi:hypothetical protein